MNSNRIGSECWYRTTSVNTSEVSFSEWRGGTLLAWSTDYEELNNGVGQYPVAVILDDKTQRCLSVPVANISFAAVPN